MVASKHYGLKILLAEDDHDDRLIIQEALDSAGLKNELECVEDGEALLRVLDHEHRSRPGVILLDLNMPRMDGREVLSCLKQSKELKDIPVVVFTTSSSQEDINLCYKLGANSFITKPTLFGDLVKTLRSFTTYWTCVVQLPTRIQGPSLTQMFRS